jgi:hypothetical protein
MLRRSPVHDQLYNLVSAFKPNELGDIREMLFAHGPRGNDDKPGSG